MKICPKCGNGIKIYVKIDGKARNLSKRKFCLDCSPFNQHNTKNLLASKAVLSFLAEKECSVCETIKPVSNFYWLKNKEAFLSRCIQCDRERSLRLNNAFKQKCVDYKGGKCVKCGFDKHVAALEFHHRDPRQKDFNISSIKGGKFERAAKELDKCDLLCSNCHRIFHAGISAQTPTENFRLGHESDSNFTTET